MFKYVVFAKHVSWHLQYILQGLKSIKQQPLMHIPVCNYWDYLQYNCSSSICSEYTQTDAFSVTHDGMCVYSWAEERDPGFYSAGIRSQREARWVFDLWVPATALLGEAAALADESLKGSERRSNQAQNSTQMGLRWELHRSAISFTDVYFKIKKHKLKHSHQWLYTVCVNRRSKTNGL